MANLIDQSKGPNHLFYGEREGQSLIDKAYLTSFAPNFTAVSEDGLGYGEKGLVTQSLKAALERERRTIFACGPQGLLAALAPLARSYGVNCYVAAEAYMACGLGVCLSCGHYLVDGSRIRLCQDGPVVDGLLMDWEKS
jgi:dihydroorotate dehydrogenase electron transfer subunit